MTDLEWKWKDDPSPLKVFYGGESATVGNWKLRVDKVRERLESPFFDSLMDSLTEKERKVFDVRMNGDPDKDIKERRRQSKKTHPYHWRVERIDGGSPETFSFLGGQAKTLEDGKRFAQEAVVFARQAYDHFNA